MSIIQEKNLILCSRFHESNFNRTAALDVVTSDMAKIPKIDPVTKTIVNYRVIDIHTGKFTRYIKD